MTVAGRTDRDAVAQCVAPIMNSAILSATTTVGSAGVARGMCRVVQAYVRSVEGTETGRVVELG